jgi:uncharacterized protein
MLPTIPPPTRSTTPPHRDARFGFRPPADGARAPFKVLISTRWLRFGLAGLMLALFGLARLPRRWQLATILSAALAGLATILSAITQARRLRVEQIVLPIDDLPTALDGMRIVQLSDLHLGWPFAAANSRRAIAWALEQRPDLIVITGDFVGETLDLPLLHATVRDLATHPAVYAIFGNHDYWDEPEALAQALALHNITLLRNQRVRLRIAGATLDLVGLDSVWEDRHNLDTAFGDLPLAVPTIVLAHEPDIADEVAQSGATVQFSGHTHAGHIALPWLGPLFLPRHGFRYVRGLLRVDSMWLYVSRGVAGRPLRLGCPPEVTAITLRRS